MGSHTNLHDLTITSHFKQLGLHEGSCTIVDNWEELLTKFWTQYPGGIIRIHCNPYLPSTWRP
jgi:hypothetical protein